jgi:streptogramin lyase
MQNGIHSDQQNNAYLLDFAAGNIVKIDAQTRKATVYTTPTPDSRPGRGRVDRDGWVGSNHGASIVKVEPLD